MEFLSVKNFEKFQHYHDRNPPWIKLYNSLLDDYLFAKLPDPQKYQLMALWLVASKTDNKIPNDTAWLKIELRATTLVNLDALIAGGWLEPWSPKKKEVWGSRYIPGEIKDSVWKRDLGKCVWCGRKTNIEFDHIVPVSRGGKSELNNLQLLCRQCNLKKHNKSMMLNGSFVVWPNNTPKWISDKENEMAKGRWRYVNAGVWIASKSFAILALTKINKINKPAKTF